mmetsp:Transcript_30866/g.45134  ORF Transcript_30866/g.45134 Transcript_30866/m.45134 type:complete len:468 (-) Transcript_30866:639-2042(-)
MKIFCAAILLAVVSPPFDVTGFNVPPNYISKKNRIDSVLFSTPETKQRAQEWTPSSWREVSSEASTSSPEVEKAAAKIKKYAPLVFAGEIRKLQEKLSLASMGQGFLLMGDDSAETFESYNVDHVRDTFKAILQMSLILTYGCALPIIKMCRMVYRLEDEEDDSESLDLVDAYHQSAQTLNILRAFGSGGFADINRLHGWNLDFVEQTGEDSLYRAFAEKVNESLHFVRAVGIDTQGPSFEKVDFFTAHDCDLLPIEEALTRKDSTTGKTYDCSAHMLFIKDPSAEDLEFIRGINNPLGLKVTTGTTPEQLLDHIDTLNPLNVGGKLSIVVRMDAESMREHLPGLIRATQRQNKCVLWLADPMVYLEVTPDGHRIRDFDKIRSELRAFFDVHEDMGSHPGGVRLEMTGKSVTECVGGEGCDVTEENVKDNYYASPGCDPRLNGNQAVELAFLVAERMRKRAGLKPIQ